MARLTFDERVMEALLDRDRDLQDLTDSTDSDFVEIMVAKDHQHTQEFI